MKITDIVCHVLMIPDVQEGDSDSAQDNFVVEIHTDEGIVGIGESDTNPWAAKAFIESPTTHTMGIGIREKLMGRDPMDIESLWDMMYVGTMMPGRRGLGVSAIGAIDMALWDIKGKALGQPCWMLLGDARQETIRPYASLQPDGGDLDTYTKSLRDWVVRAKEYGFTAAKLEVTLGGPYAHGGLDAPEEKTVDVVAACREAVGPDFTIMVDVQYAWQDARQAMRTLKHLEPLDLFFLETPLSIDDLEGYAYLHDNLDIRIAAGEWQTTRFEFIDLMDRGKIDVAQPDVGRVGGLTEAQRVCRLAEDRGRLIVPHCWKSGIGIAASAHMAFNTANCPYIEFLPAELCHSVMRKELVADEISIEDGVIGLPTKPGLGVELNRECLERLKVE
tara:strand:- start:550 stop:1719 length:1170 start_codon:yes stop_codon:yes gene_type:complete